MNIIVYGQPSCLGCINLKNHLKLAKIDHEFISDYDANFLNDLGFTTIPVLQVDDKYYNSDEALTWVMKQVENKETAIPYNPDASITVYGKDTCISCIAAKKVLEQLGLEYNYITDYAPDF